MKVRVTTSGLTRLRSKVNRKAQGISPAGLRKALNEAGAELVELYTKRIESFTPGDVPDLSPDYKKRKAKRYGSAYPILKASGQLIDSMYHKLVEFKPGSALLRIGFQGTRSDGSTNAEVARGHLSGLKLPVRDFTRVSAEWRKALFARIRKHSR